MLLGSVVPSSALGICKNVWTIPFKFNSYPIRQFLDRNIFKCYFIFNFSCVVDTRKCCECEERWLELFTCFSAPWRRSGFWIDFCMHAYTLLTPKWLDEFYSYLVFKIYPSQVGDRQVWAFQLQLYGALTCSPEAEWKFFRNRFQIF
jgi:hypothetical protein